MQRLKILSVEETEKAGLFTICFTNDNQSEFEKFITKFKDDAYCQRDLQVILSALQHMLRTSGFLERYFRPEGKMKDNVCALPIESGRLRLYCLRLSDSVLIVGNGGKKTTKTYNESEELSGYVISLQKLDELIKVAVRKGDIIIEEKSIQGIEKKEFDL